MEKYRVLRVLVDTKLEILLKQKLARETLREPSIERTVCRENSVLTERCGEVIACEGNYSTVCAGLCIVHRKQEIKFEGVYKLLCMCRLAPWAGPPKYKIAEVLCDQFYTNSLPDFCAPR
jgi:hypothetical protein